MFRFFSLTIALYPAEYRAEFGGEMRAVLGELGRKRPTDGFVSGTTS